MRAGLLVLILAACGGRTQPPDDPAVIDATPAPVAPLDAARAACRGGDCDALADYWGARELLPADRTGKDDAVLLAAACDDRGDAAACFAVALMHKYGTAGVRDDDLARAYFARVRTLGDLNGFRGEPPSDEGRAAIARAEEGCAAGRARACAQLGWAAFSAVQQAKDAVAAYRWWRRACDLGNSTGCRWAGHVAYTYPETGAAADADALLRRSCELDNAGGCDELGRYLVHQGNAAAAAPIFTAACADGSRDGCADAGAASAALGTEEGRRTAAALLARACEAGEAGACTGLAGLVARGRCTLDVADAPPLGAAAVAALRTACGKGDAAACAAVDGCP